MDYSEWKYECQEDLLTKCQRLEAAPRGVPPQRWYTNQLMGKSSEVKLMSSTGESEQLRRSGGRTPHGVAQRRELVLAAFNLIAEKGFEGLRTRDVAQRADLNIATLHYY